MNQSLPPNPSVRLPLFLALAMSVGILIGAKMFSGQSTSHQVNKNVGRFREVLNYIERFYVDSTNSATLTDFAIEKMLERLDPHTSYIPAEEVEAANADLEGEFEGIGIEFSILRDSLCVSTALSGGPAEAAGLRPGDRIVQVDEKEITGKKVSSREIFSLLRGKKGTKVRVAVARRNTDQLLYFNIVRDKIPTNTVQAAYLMPPNTAYIKINRFGAKTYDEFQSALKKLLNQGAKQLLLDLRDNPGGYLPVAEKIADELLGGEKLIVYTKAKEKRAEETYKAEIDGLFEDGAVIVLIDEGSASASEIVAGALQDNDRALIVGRRSYGKGLVQRPISLADGSELRLTIARYYTPSGRCIQRPYDHEHLTDYRQELLKRQQHGEFFVADSIHFDEKQKFITAGGRVVYGGGGIMPDVFVPADTANFTDYHLALDSADVLRDFSIDYGIRYEKTLKEKGQSTFVKNFELPDSDLALLIAQGEKIGLRLPKAKAAAAALTLKLAVKAWLARQYWGYEAQYQVYNQTDLTVQKALTLFEKAAELAQLSASKK
jgi:carboxyl-terminal processing protease